jgi:hypothetical protein
VTDDVRLQIGNADVVNGKAEFTWALEAFFASVAGFPHTVTNVWSDVDAVITELNVHYTRLDGIELTLPCCNVFRGLRVPRMRAAARQQHQRHDPR